jgi:hypothetical protein
MPKCSRCGELTPGPRHVSPEACIAALLEARRNLIAALRDRETVMFELVKHDRPLAEHERTLHV